MLGLSIFLGVLLYIAGVSALVCYLFRDTTNKAPTMSKPVEPSVDEIIADYVKKRLKEAEDQLDRWEADFQAFQWATLNENEKLETQMANLALIKAQKRVPQGPWLPTHEQMVAAGADYYTVRNACGEILQRSYSFD